MCKDVEFFLRYDCCFDLISVTFFLVNMVGFFCGGFSEEVIFFLKKVFFIFFCKERGVFLEICLDLFVERGLLSEEVVELVEFMW